jgi:hypothetical protein
MGRAKSGFLRDAARRNPARRVGSLDDIVAAALLALANSFVTCTTLHV